MSISTFLISLSIQNILVCLDYYFFYYYKLETLVDYCRCLWKPQVNSPRQINIFHHHSRWSWWDETATYMDKRVQSLLGHNVFFYAINNRRMFCAWILTSVSLVRYVTWLNILQEKPVFLPNKISKWVLQIYGHNLQTPPATSNLNRTETAHIWKLFVWPFLTKTCPPSPLKEGSQLFNVPEVNLVKIVTLHIKDEVF